MKKTQKAASVILAAAMALQAAPLAGLGLTVQADGEWSKFADGVTTLGTGVISAPKAPEYDTDAWTGSYVYYGQYKKKPVKYRVLDPNTSVFGGTTMFLDCDTALFADEFRYDDWEAADAHVWTKSDLYKVLNTNDDAFLNTAFTDAESAAIAESTRETHVLVEGSEAGNVASWTARVFVNYTPLTGEKIFLLDVEDASNTAYGYSVTNDSDSIENRKKKHFTKPDRDADWWLRSGKAAADRYGYAGCVYNPSSAAYAYANRINLINTNAISVSVSPAFNVDLSSVIFSSKVEDADGAYGDAYKLTLKDNNTKLTVGDVTRDGNTVAVPYQRTDSDSADGITANQVSVLILGSDNAIKYYAPLKSSSSASGTGTFVVPSDVTGSDKVYVFAEDVNSQYLTDYASEMTEISIMNGPKIQNASLTLSDDLGLNFYMTSAITNEDADLYTVRFDGECLEDGQTVQLAKKEDNKFYATAHVYAKNLEKKITATLCKGDEIIDTKEYSVADYLDSAAETVTDARALALIKATKAFGAVSAEYFYGGDHGFDSAFAAYLTQSNLTESEIVSHAKRNAYTTDFTTDDAKISLVLDSKTAIRLYVKGVQPDESNGLMPSKQANKDEYPSYYEIEGLTPDKLAKEQSVNIGGTTYKFNALAWANRILNHSSASNKNVRMAKAIMAYYLAARDYANTIS